MLKALPVIPANHFGLWIARCGSSLGNRAPAGAFAPQMSFASKVQKAMRRLSRPGRGEARRSGVVIHPFRGYGTADEVFLIGRVFRESLFGKDETPGNASFTDFLRRTMRYGVGEAHLTARLGEAEQQVETDKDGYFRVNLKTPTLAPPRDGWHEVEITLDQPESAAGARVKCPVYVPPETVRFAVISDIDDTVVQTGVANVVTMMWNLFFKPAESRVVYPGLGPFYRALHTGAGGDEMNPMLYVSRGPWSLYDTLEQFFHLHDIPVGPILFLREWGLTLQSPLPRKAEDHKRDLIRHMLETYDGLPFVLIGDSGQHDPEIYAEIVREHPDRVIAVYIRDVSGHARDAELAGLADELEKAGSPLILAEHTHEMAAHAATLGLVPRDTPERVNQPAERR